MITRPRQRRETQEKVAVSYEERVKWRQWFERLDREMEANPAIWVRVFGQNNANKRTDR